MTDDAFVADENLDPETREALSVFTTARSDAGGVLWPSDEVSGELLPERFPPEWEHRLQEDEAVETAESDTENAAESPLSNAHVAQEVARRQSRRRVALSRGVPTNNGKPSRWLHVPLVDLFEAAGNRLFKRGNGVVECGHEPMHGSRGGRCVALDPKAGLWWCRSCRRGGDAATFVMDRTGCSAAEAATELTDRYGPPSNASSSPRPSSRRRIAAVTIP
jgi:hypothetical protein